MFLLDCFNCYCCLAACVDLLCVVLLFDCRLRCGGLAFGCWVWCGLCLVVWFWCLCLPVGLLVWCCSCLFIDVCFLVLGCLIDRV